MECGLIGMKFGGEAEAGVIWRSRFDQISSFQQRLGAQLGSCRGACTCLMTCLLENLNVFSDFIILFCFVGMVVKANVSVGLDMIGSETGGLYRLSEKMGTSSGFLEGMVECWRQ